ncbi:putative EEV maturation protein [Lumpy skin disease virus]|uniref:EEV maturation protein n=1 Tax=Lumpy skin disease virus TaxID=59509 RepID=A0A1C9HHP8_LSDV|nr:putative EEV maturation protein [Lumpy skin disease virus]AOO78587.1 putative EEV maturation protein [Lumpy skin disease virus]AOO78746.1 putative EEV maturation protein [Lumpy skin disease virus]AOO78904.1 putative EEV maturation protein [Lumpy skin disease virus]AVR51464.1 putative EEV maturation protein [Lumpy skin disease virus]
MFKKQNNEFNIINALETYKHSIILARLGSGKGVIIYLNNLDLVRSVTKLSHLEIVGITKYVEPYFIDMHMHKLFIDEVDTETFFSPKTSISPLVDIVKRRALENDKINKSVHKLHVFENKNISLSEINYWMCDNGLSNYRFVNYKNSKKGNDDYTLIDEMIIGCIGKHYIWVKQKKKYNRPELDILPYNVKSIASKRLWSKNNIYDEVVTIIPIIINSIITPLGPSIYMMTSFGKSFINFNSKELILCFLKWLKETILINIKTAFLVGFLSNVFDFLLLKASWPKNIGWNFIGNDYIVSDDGFKLILVDIANFSCKMEISDYFKQWNNKKKIIIPKDFITEEEAKCKIKALEKMALESVLVLYDSINKQYDVLNNLIYPFNMFSFNRIEDIFLTKIIQTSLSKVNNFMYYPLEHDTVRFIMQLIRFKNVKTVNYSPKKKFVIFKVKSILDIISLGRYPIGFPIYKRSIDINNNNLYIALCKVSKNNNVKIPIIDDELETSVFFTPLTSIDIKLMRKIGGYKIKELGVLEWENSITFHNDDFMKTIDHIKEILSDDIVDYIVNNNELLEHYENNTTLNNYLLLFKAFSISYCRFNIHSLIQKIDSHFLGDYVLMYNYKEIYISDDFKKDKNALYEMIYDL